MADLSEIFKKKDELKKMAEQCNAEIQEVLKKYNCKLESNPKFSIDKDGRITVEKKISVVPLFQIREKLKKPEYIN